MCQIAPGARKLPTMSIALDEYVLKTYPDMQKVAPSLENDRIRGQLSLLFFVVPDLLSA